MLSVQPGAWDESEEKLRSIGVWSSVSHGKETWLGVLDVEVFILELSSIDGLSSSSVSDGEVSSLGHEIGDDSVEGGSLVMEGFSGFSDSLLSSAEGSEVGSGQGDNVVVQGKNESGWLSSVDGDIEEAVLTRGSHFI